MSGKTKVEKLPSGKVIYRHFDSSGEMTSELQSHFDSSGKRVIASLSKFDKGRKTGELYSAERVISRAEYEKLRPQYPDMPAADTSVADVSAEVLDNLGRKRAEAEAAARRLGLDPTRLTDDDLFCATLMAQGPYADAADWIQRPGRTLGELDQSQSCLLVAKLNELGAVAVSACDIDPGDEGPANTRYVVVELPTNSPARAALFAEVTGLAEERGFDGYSDQGQMYLYIKLD